jgi:mRNA interferase MazF
MDNLRGLSTEVAVGPANGLEHRCVISCGNIVTVSGRALDRQLGYLLPGQEAELAVAIRAAFDLG